MRKYGESKMTRIMMATVPHVTFGLGLRNFQADGFLLTWVYLSSTQTPTSTYCKHPAEFQGGKKILPIHKNLEPTEWGHKDQEMSEYFTHLLSTQCFLLISSLPPHQFGSYLFYFVVSLLLSHNLSTRKLFSLQLLIWLPL